MPDPQTIDADKLCALTGLTDRRHRQIADQGFFPPPTKGKYQLTPTIAGMFKYYREAYQRATQSLVEDKQVKLKREIELLELKIAEQQKKLVPVVMVERVWTGIANAIRQTIIASDIHENSKKELSEKIRAIDPEEYCDVADFGDSEEVDSADKAAACPDGL